MEPVRRLRELTEGGGSRELGEALASARLYCQAADRPGVLALGEPGAGLVPAFTSPGRLAAYVAARGESEAASCFSTLGADLLGLLPPGYGLIIDPGTDHALILTPGMRPTTSYGDGVGDRL